MTVTIVVITYNSNHVLPRFLKGLHLAGHEFELIVIDNASRESPVDLVSHSVAPGGEMYNGSVRFIQNPVNLMYTRAANQGFRAAMGDLVLIMNPDCYGIDQDWLKRMVAMWEEKKPDIAGFKLVRDWSQDGNSPHPENPYWEIEHVGARHPGVHLGKGQEDKGQYDSARELAGELEYVTGACFMVSQETLKRFGHLPEQHVHYASDREYCIHVRKSGGHVWYLPIRMVHLFGKSVL